VRKRSMSYTLKNSHMASNLESQVPGLHHHRILNLEPEGYCQEAQVILANLGNVTNGPLSRQDLLVRLSEFDVAIVRLGHQIDEEVLRRGIRLRAIVSATTGLDHIDLKTAEAQHIEVLSLQGEEAFLRSIVATAEYTWGLLLSLMRRIPEA